MHSGLLCKCSYTYHAPLRHAAGYAGVYFWSGISEDKISRWPSKHWLILITCRDKIINNVKKGTVLFIGNVLSIHGYNLSQLELLTTKLSKYVTIKTFSNKLNKLHRMIDMLLGIFLNRSQKTIVFIDTYRAAILLGDCFV